jgi:hypothetical protein
MIVLILATVVLIIGIAVASSLVWFNQTISDADDMEDLM